MNSIFDDIVYKTFGCSFDQESFDKFYAARPAEERDRLNHVASRVWMTLQLRYRFTYEPNPTLRGGDWLLLTYTEKPSLEIYLLATCLDTLAGQPGNKDFDEWLAEQILPDQVVDKTKISALYKNWRKEYGVSQPLKLLFKQLPSDLMNWLSNCIVFQKYSGTPDLNMKFVKYFF